MKKLLYLLFIPTLVGLFCLVSACQSDSSESTNQSIEESLKSGARSSISLELIPCDEPESAGEPSMIEGPKAVHYVEGGEHFLGVYLGRRPTGGYSIEAVSAAVEDEVLMVVAVVRSPEPGDMVTQAITYPRAFYKIDSDRSFEAVRLKIETKEKGK